MYKRIGLLACFSLGLVEANEDKQPPIPPEHNQAVQLARSGKGKQAIKMLDELGKKHGHYKGYDEDYAVVLTMVRQDKKAVSYYQKNIKKDEAPVYVLEAMGDAYYRLAMPDKAKSIYEFALKKDPKNLRSQLGLVRLDLNNGRNEEAISRLDKLSETYPKDKDVLLLKAKADKAIKNPTPVTSSSEKARKKEAEDNESIKKRILLLSDSGAAIFALEEANKHPNLFNESDWRELRSRQITVLSRWARMDANSDLPFDKRYKRADQVIVLIKQYLVSENSEADIAYNLRLKYDLMTVYYYRNKPQETVNLYWDVLRQVGSIDKIPSYVLESVGSAFLDIKQPEYAKDVFLKVYEENKTSQIALSGLYYACLELEQHEEALKYAEIYKDTFKKWIEVGPSAVPNPDREIAEDLYSSVYNNSEELNKSQEYLRDAIVKAPFNTDFRNNLTSLYRARFLPRTAEKEAKIGLALDPENVALKLNQAGILMSLNEFEEAEKIVEELKQKYPDNSQVKQLLEEWDYHNSRILDMTYGYRRNYGTSTFFGKREDFLEGLLYSKPILYNYRGYISERYDHGRYDNGTLYQTYTRAGIDYRGRKFSGELAVNYSRYGKHKLGGFASIAIPFTDHWLLRGYADLVSSDTPAKGLLDDVSSNAFGVGGQYYHNESFYIDAGGKRQNYTDRNHRWEGFAQIRKRIFGNYEWKIDGILDFYSSQARYSQIVSYYSPKKDYVADLQILIDHRIYRDYQFSISHTLTLSGGTHWEKNYGSKKVGFITYEQVIEQQNRYFIKYGVQRRRASYDGDIENSNFYYIRFNVRF